ncbi:MAG TPA: 4-alpha-glucanotransferase [Gemmatimonadaceae bacterium]|nr:4-alpha-glucanotransferase [Gemmatimonadaceae bacterium]
MMGADPPLARPALRALADRMGICSEYVDQSGAERRVTADRTRVALLGAMGVDASSESAARAALRALDVREDEQLVPCVHVALENETHGKRVRVRLPPGWRSHPLEWSIELHEEGGAVHEGAGVLRRDRAREIWLPLPLPPEPGYHTVRLRLCGPPGDVERRAEQMRIVTPRHCPTPTERLDGRRVFGITADLYALRGARDWGVGDMTDLRHLLEWSADVGAAFVGLNPLHALRNCGSAVSPYSPVSRLFRNVLYLDVEAIPEFADCAEARALVAHEDTRAALSRLHQSDRVQYDQVMALKRPVLEALHRAFARTHRGTRDARGMAYARYLAAQGEPLTAFATFLALEAHFGKLPAPPTSWREWPAAFRDPHSAAVAAFRASHHEAVDFHCWLQFELDRQLAAAADAGRAAGMAIGLYQDLAIGTAGDGSDAWAFPELFAKGVSIGAPPDALAAQGQNWALPPLDPHRLRESGYRYWTLLLRSALDHAGAIRIDHILGLFRQFWIPDGRPGFEGAYVRFPTRDLLGILALESTRHGALVVGEDLGTVPREVPPTLKRWGILASRVLYFERYRRGGFRPVASYEPLSLTTANTHDLPPLAGFWTGHDILLRRSAGSIPSDTAARVARSAREGERRALLRRLAADGALPAAREPATPAELRGAVHDFLCRTPAALVGFSLADLTGETEPVNIPGVGQDRYPSWTRRLHLPVEALRTDPDVATALRCGQRGTGGSGGGGSEVHGGGDRGGEQRL